MRVDPLEAVQKMRSSSYDAVVVRDSRRCRRERALRTVIFVFVQKRLLKSLLHTFEVVTAHALYAPLTVRFGVCAGATSEVVPAHESRSCTI